jgi:hypothetical protein
MLFRSCLMAAIAALALGDAARADFIFEFGQGGVISSTNSFTVNQGSTISIQVFLAQTNGPTTNSSNLSLNGLQQGGESLSYTNAPFNIASVSNITPNSAFSGPNNTQLSSTTGTATATLQVNGRTPVFPAYTDSNGNSAVLLGSFTFTGASAGSGLVATSFPDPSSANNVDGAANDLDSLIQQSSAVITVTAVPEPSAFLLAGVLATGIAGIALRRIRGRQPA